MQVKTSPVTAGVELSALEAPSTTPPPASGLRSKLKGVAWTPEHCDLLLQDFKAAKGKTIVDRHKAVANLWNMGHDNVKKQLAVINKKAKSRTGIDSRMLKISGKW